MHFYKKYSLFGRSEATNSFDELST